MPVIPPGFAHCANRFALVGDPEPIFVTFGLDVSGVSGDFTAAAINVSTAWAAANSPLNNLSNQYTLNGIILTVGQDGGDPIIVEYSPSQAGRSSSAPMPQNCAYLVRKRTGLGGRQHRGRLFMPGLNETLVDPAGVMSSATVAVLQGDWDAFLAAVNDPTPMVILHSDPLVGSPPAPTDVTSLPVDNRIATQRRRLRR